MTERRVVTLPIDEADIGYFEACARIRDINMRSLFRRVVKAIATDHLVASILDDEVELRRRYPGEKPYRAGGFLDVSEG